MEVLLKTEMVSDAELHAETTATLLTQENVLVSNSLGRAKGTVIVSNTLGRAMGTVLVSNTLGRAMGKIPESNTLG